MGKRYRRYHRSGTGFVGLFANVIVRFLLIAGILFRQSRPIILGIAVVIGLMFLIRYIRNKKPGSNKKDMVLKDDEAWDDKLCDTEFEHNDLEASTIWDEKLVGMDSNCCGYSAKNSIMTDCEKDFFEAFKSILGSEYIVQPQINLASIVNKDTKSRYQNELFRNIDFGVFDKNYSLKILIEINDQTHMKKSRIDRDNKVKSICAEAGIPLITFWTKYGVNTAYIRKRLSEYLILEKHEISSNRE